MDLRQAELAQALGITPQFVGMMERGEKPIEPRTALSVLYLVDHPETRPYDDEDDDNARSRSYSPAELYDAAVEARRLYDGRTWGRWRFSADSLTLDLDSREEVVDRNSDGDVIERRERYYVMLCNLIDARHVADWIGQVAGKGWGAVTTGHFVEALDTIFSLQSRFAHGKGFWDGNAVDDYLRSRLAAGEARRKLPDAPCHD